MIRAVIVMNTQGKPRLLKFYEFQPPEKQQELTRSVFAGQGALLSGRPDNVSNFVEADAIFGPVIFSSLLFVSFVAEITKKKKQEEFKEGTRLVYKHLATLYFVFVFDSCENELAMLDLIQVLVETLDRCFKNVCELDIVFNFNKMHTILDEIIFGGQVLETSSERVLKAVEEISRLEKSSSSVSFVPKSVSGRFGR
ncbi:AP-3 complex subunit [Musa troglodytarum]|uniref:AP complex subunit sigma n=1 Tax=Musa troglodytarum TaxID=320322 RepID=A0A9E7HH15_9LILI|nr:AP-3 complex subunit [Musa troglodytarum]